MQLNLNDLLAYTAWERQNWYDCLKQHGKKALKIHLGPNRDGRFETVGDLVKHIFSAEKRYVARITGQPLSDFADLPNDNVEALFQFSQQSRKELQHLLETFPEAEWDRPKEFKVLNYSVKATPKKIVVHILMHEIRHWAQIATLLRLNGLPSGPHDFLVSPVFGGEFKEEAKV